MTSEAKNSKPWWMTEELRESMRSLAKMHARLREQAPDVEQLIDGLDGDISRALREDEDENPLSRRMAYRTTLWAQSGWFPAKWETPITLISQTAELLGSDRNDEAESAIVAHFDGNAAKFIGRVIEKNPSRDQILRDALYAHQNKLYSLSIPTLLIQADGIASQFFGFDSIYTVSQRNFERIRQRFDQHTDAFRIGYLHFLIGTLTPLNASRGRRNLYSEPFNRHLVIHGESTDYPSHINSLRAISWIQFVSGIVNAEETN